MITVIRLFHCLNQVFLFLIVATPLLSFGVSPSLSPVGFFYFGRYLELNPEYVKSSPVRVRITWGAYEPNSTAWVPDNFQDKKVKELTLSGYSVIPTIRAISPWAVEFPEAPCSSAPLDLDRVKPLGQGQSYSATYYRFIKRIAQHYKGTFEVVVIENEPNDPKDQWCSSIDDYLRMVLTAKKAFFDAGVQVAIADGGIQGEILVWVILEYYLNQNKTQEAIQFYEKFSGESITLEALSETLKTKSSKATFKRAKELYQGPLFDFLDILNFHHYQLASSLPEMVQFLNERNPLGKPIITNEAGIKWKYVNDRASASKELVKKYALFLTLGVNLGVWFSPEGEKNNNAGALFDSLGNFIVENKLSFETASRFLGRRPLAHQDLSTPEIQQFRFTFPKQKIRVFWPKKNDNLSPLPVVVDRNCRIFNYQNQEFTGEILSSGGAPYFEVCDRFHSIFITSAKYQGDLGGLKGADAICMSHARNRLLAGDWIALLSDRRTNARDRVILKNGVVNINNELVSKGTTGLWTGILQNPIRYNERGLIPVNNMRVAWTATARDGTIYNPRNDCNGWTSSSDTDQAVGGNSAQPTSDWIEYHTSGQPAPYSSGCNGYLALYCISKDPL